MPKTTAEKIATKREQIQQLQNEEKQLIQKQKEQDRKDRTKRLCQRHGLLEKLMPDLAAITDEQFETFIRKGINTSYGQKILAEIVGDTKASTTQQAAETAAQSKTAPATDKAKTTPQTQAAERYLKGNLDGTTLNTKAWKKEAAGLTAEKDKLTHDYKGLKEGVRQMGVVRRSVEHILDNAEKMELPQQQRRHNMER